MTKQLLLWTVAITLLLSACGGGDRPAATKAEAAATTAAAPAASAPAQTAPAAAPTAPEVMDASSVVVPAPEETRMEIPKVFVNGRELTPAQLEAFKQVYGVIPAPGHWWYDAVSGMYGTEGQGATGFMYPGHDLGPLAADASHGNMPVFINGRQLTQVEVNYLAWLAGGAVAPGRYWVDALLNWGYEGVPVPAGNLRQLAAARSGGGGRGGGGGDNTWSGLVGAGNYNDDNTVGYVSIPGVGPIGSYGM
jgi:hypothetical protein